MNEKSILLVEDNPDDVALTIRALKKNNVPNDIVVARDGAEALELLFGTPDKPPMALPELVLLDLNMPKINGLEVLQKIRDTVRTRLLPVIVLTTSDEERDRAESYCLGANSYVVKPVEFAEFSKAVMNLGLYWLVFNVGPYSH